METSTTPTPQQPNLLDSETKNWAIIMHLSLLAGFLVPLAGLIAPVVIYLLKREALPDLVPHGHVIFNWMVSYVIYFVIGLVLSIVLIGLPILIALGLLGVIFPIVGAVKASEGVVWRYPLSITVFSQTEPSPS